MDGAWYARVAGMNGGRKGGREREREGEGEREREERSGSRVYKE